MVIPQTLISQVYVEGVLKVKSKGYHVDDTVTFYGTREDKTNKKLYYLVKNSNKEISAENVNLITQNRDFWDIQQFYYISAKIARDGWELKKRESLEQKTLNFLARLETENKIYKDEYTEDYLQKLIQKIHNPKIWKGRDQYLVVKILNSEKPVIYAFDNGTILISTQFIVNTSSEQELMRVLAEAVAHVMLDSNIRYADNDSESDYRQLGAIYPESVKKRNRIIAERFMNHYEKKNNGSKYSSDNDFLIYRAGIISYTAWQEYHNQHYTKALDYVKILYSAQIANSSDYLLLAKIYMKMVDTPEANQAAISHLKKAASFNDQLLPKIYAELGVVLMREGRYEEAKEIFTKCYDLAEKDNDEEKMRWALKMINNCNRYLGDINI